MQVLLYPLRVAAGNEQSGVSSLCSIGEPVYTVIWIKAFCLDLFSARGQAWPGAQQQRREAVHKGGTAGNKHSSLWGCSAFLISLK